MYVKSNDFGALNSQSKDRRLKFCDRFQNATKRLRESGRHQFRRAVRQRWNPFDCRPSTLREHAGDESGILRKKLHLALEAERGFTSGDPMLECAGRLEPGWVLRWLDDIGLPQYKGVHGGLMVHEDRFTETLLASLLSIPAEKTLLRRHLATHFKELLGSDVIQKKREAESTLGYVPLTPSLKAKVARATSA
ncbi:unnamed protein product [Nesidiocoris tenuis]|uniref:SAM domain-containing protein n=1 Tax=Nesidiocoris tenuis TaxID=355587 RepID=A0A6H5HD65_9HEMI|nr:unnamed protein product [Nesidiocoris tenuis]